MGNTVDPYKVYGAIARIISEREAAEVKLIEVRRKTPEEVEREKAEGMEEASNK